MELLGLIDAGSSATVNIYSGSTGGSTTVAADNPLILRYEPGEIGFSS